MLFVVRLKKLITKNTNGVTIQICMVLIAYLILELIEIPTFYGHKLLSKLHYLQLELRRQCSITYWSFNLLPKILV